MALMDKETAIRKLRAINAQLIDWKIDALIAEPSRNQIDWRERVPQDWRKELLALGECIEGEVKELLDMLRQS